MESLLKVLSYNLFGAESDSKSVPTWEHRQLMLSNSLHTILNECYTGVNVAFFQEVNDRNIEMLNKVLEDTGYVIVCKASMVVAGGELQYNVIALHESLLKYVECTQYVKHDKNSLSGNMVYDCDLSEERATAFVHLRINNKLYILGNIHADHMSIQGKIHGVCKSLGYINNSCENASSVGLLLGDMNMITHMAEAQAVLRDKPQFETLSLDKARPNSTHVNSYHGYGQREEANVDFAFIPKDKANLFKYEILSKKIMEDEGSDHRPVVVTIFNEDHTLKDSK